MLQQVPSGRLTAASVATRMPEYFVGIDLGTSGVRAAATDASGAGLLSISEPWPAGGAESPAAWRTTSLDLLRRIAARLPPVPATLAVAGTSGTLLLLDAAGAPLLPPLMYNDARACLQAARLSTMAPPGNAAQGASSSAAKLLWLRDQGLARRAARVLHQAEWIAASLRNDFGLGDENNALKLGYDPWTRSWPEWWLSELGTSARLLPEITPSGTPLGPVDPRIAADIGLHPDSIIAAGTTDGVAGFLATGTADPHTGVTSLGSTLVLKQLVPEPLFEPSTGVYSHRVLDRWLAGGASNSGGAVLARFFSPKEMAALSRSIDPANDSGLDYYPLPAPGERFPFSDPLLEPRLMPRPACDGRFLQGLFEGIARIEAAGYARLAELGAPPIRRILTVGGGAENPAWTALRARVIGVPVSRAAESQPARGAALLALHASRARG